MTIPVPLGEPMGDDVVFTMTVREAPASEAKIDVALWMSEAMTGEDFAVLLHRIADQFQSGENIRRVDTPERLSPNYREL